MRRSDHFETFTWIIEDFTKQNIIKLCSKSFKIRGYTWRLLVYPLKADVNHFSIYLMVDDSLPPYGWTRNTYFKLALINQIDRRKSIEKVTQQKFKGGHTSWGSFFMNLNDFYDYKQGYLVRNTCIIEAHICVSNFAPLEFNNNMNSNIIAPVNNDSMTFNQQTEHRGSVDDEMITLTPSTSSSSSPPGSDHPDQGDDEIQSSKLTLKDLLDYQTFSPQERESLIPLLEEICTLHPSLLHSQRDRTEGFRTWAFKSLGQVLHFLKTKKVKDITEDDIKNLKGLWDELVKSSGFEDLAWLEPFVQSAFGVNKSHLQSAKKLRKLKDIVVSLEIKMKKLRGELAAAEAEFQVARRDLCEARKGFQKIDVNATIGYRPCSR